ncbi:PREDICTED: calcium/calmodulin-regulated receptor-like kinase 1 [Amphimedon queenslandica]|nr:PREDICTED: calcium/calmodulin-regulated receptor-like kinase 1 [Amphimedon queenslandica]|eukprot:XP_019863105.1 PREDICTED: calcium/calmodulin-regulated receptor-like kinase 1 [Amphimedon queenslandica]
MKYSILDVAKGLCYLHGKRPPIVHCDLTANNVLLTSSYSAKISDLGVSRLADTFKNHHLTTVPGNAMVMPPENLEDNPVYDHKLDVFSYGCLILHVLSGRFPQPTDQFIQKPGRAKSFKKVQEWDRRSKYIEQIPKENELVPLAQKCLNDDPKYRPDMTELAQKLSKLKIVDLEAIETGVRATLAVNEEEENTASVTQVMYTLVVQHEKKGVGYWITTFSVVRDIKLYNENTHFADKERGSVFTFQYNQPNGVLSGVYT